MDIDTNKNSTSEIDTVYEKKLRVTCIERKYKIVDSKASFIIVAKKEFDEDTTEKMLHEDMELKTFLANYEIKNITYPSSDIENVKIQKKKIPEMGKHEMGKPEMGKPEMGKPEMGKSEMGKKEESETVKKRRDIITNTLKRRELFDSLDLPDEFLVRDYIEAIEKNGLKISNSAMPYDDLKWLTKKGKVKMINKTERGVTTYEKIKKTEIDDEKESRSDDNQSVMYYDKAVLPSKQLIDRHLS